MILPILGGIIGGNAIANSAREDERRRARVFPDSEQFRQQQYDMFMAQNRAGREQDMQAGRRRGEELFGNQALGRVREGRSTDVNDIIARRRANLEGFTPTEMNDMRVNQMGSMLQTNQGLSRQLAAQQARSGVRGATAAAQQMGLANDLTKQQGALERQLFLDNINARRQGLDAFESSIGQAEASDLARQQYNQQQKQRELMGILGAELGFAGLGASDRAAAAQNAIAQQQLMLSNRENQKEGK